MPPGVRVHPIPDRHRLNLDLDPVLVISAFILCLALAKRGFELYFFTTRTRQEMLSYKKSPGGTPADTAAKKPGAGMQIPSLIKGGALKAGAKPWKRDKLRALVNGGDGAATADEYRCKLEALEKDVAQTMANLKTIAAENRRRTAALERQRDASMARARELEAQLWTERHRVAVSNTRCTELEAWAKDLEDKHVRAVEERVWTAEMHRMQVDRLEGTLRWSGEVLKQKALELDDVREELEMARTENSWLEREYVELDITPRPGREAAPPSADNDNDEDDDNEEIAIMPFPARRASSPPYSTPTRARDRPLLRTGVLISQALQAHGSPPPDCTLEMLAQCVPRPLMFSPPGIPAPRVRMERRAPNGQRSLIPRPSNVGMGLLNSDDPFAAPSNGEADGGNVQKTEDEGWLF